MINRRHQQNALDTISKLFGTIGTDDERVINEQLNLLLRNNQQTYNTR